MMHDKLLAEERAWDNAHELIVTAVPDGTRWQVKVIDRKRRRICYGDFESRGAALTEAANVISVLGGFVMP